MKIYGMTDTGMCRMDNQDYFSACTVAPPPRIKGARKREKEALLAVVCDGMGGAKGGALASRLATETFMHTVMETRAHHSEDALQEAFAAANAAVYEKAQEDEALHGMGTTIVAALVYEKHLSLLHVGDSRIYLWHAGELSLLTHDHSYVQQMIDSGKMTPEEARHSRYKNLITRALGTAKETVADTVLCKWDVGDKLLLCTDGLIGFVDEAEMCSVLSEDIPAEQTVHELIGAANSRGCDDNLTALLLENIKEKQ